MNNYKAGIERITSDTYNTDPKFVVRIYRESRTDVWECLFVSYAIQTNIDPNEIAHELLEAFTRIHAHGHIITA
jgi:hypothetical protein